MSSENWVKPRPPGGETRLQQQDAELAAVEDDQPRERRSQGASQDGPPPQPRSPTQDKTQEVTSEPREGEGQPREDGKRGTSVRRRSGEPGTETQQQDGGPGVCLEERCRRRPSPRSSHPERDRDRRGQEPRGPGPFYFFGGGNGASIVTSYCESRGWQRIYDKTRDDFKLKWCETKSPVTYCNFREGEQLLYQIPNNKVLTTKIGLLNSLREYDRISSKVNHGQGLRRLKMEQFFPATFRMDLRDERDAFFAQEEGVCGDEEPSAWICKPTGLNQGRGIFLLRGREDLSTLRLKLQNGAESQGSNRKQPFRAPQARIVQRYIQNPLLLKGRKFDVRSYILIACTAPYMVLFRHGYARLTCDLYDPNSNNLSAHLTNQYMQKKNPLYSVLKEETVWSMERFNTYVNDKFSVAKGLPRDWVLGAFTKRMQQIMIQCFFAAKSKLERKLGYFDLIGCDFMIDEDFKVWLLEMNCNPALHTNCEVLKEVVPSTVVEALDLTMEIFNKCRCGLKILPLASLRDFELLYDGETAPTAAPALARRSKTAITLRAQRPKSTSSQKAPNNKTQSVESEAAGSGDPDDPVTPTTSRHTPTAAVSETLPSADSTPTIPAPPTASSPLLTQVTTTPLHSSAKPTLTPTPRASLDTPKPSVRRPPKPAPHRARVELRLSKCTWQRRLAGNQPEHSSRPPHPDLQRVKKTTFMSLSTPALTDGSRLLSVRRLRAGNKACPGSDRDQDQDQAQPFCCTLKSTLFRLAQPGSVSTRPQPVWRDRQEKGGGGGGGQEETQEGKQEEPGEEGEE